MPLWLLLRKENSLKITFVHDLLDRKCCGRHKRNPSARQMFART